MGQYNIASLRETIQNYIVLWELIGPENVTYNYLECGYEVAVMRQREKGSWNSSVDEEAVSGSAGDGCGGGEKRER